MWLLYKNVIFHCHFHYITVSRQKCSEQFDSQLEQFHLPLRPKIVWSSTPVVGCKKLLGFECSAILSFFRGEGESLLLRHPHVVVGFESRCKTYLLVFGSSLIAPKHGDIIKRHHHAIHFQRCDQLLILIPFFKNPPSLGFRILYTG